MTGAVLKAVDLVRASGEPTLGLVPIRQDRFAQEGLSIDEQVAVLEAQSFRDIDFVFFRRFSDGRSSQVAAYVIDNSEERFDAKALARLHLQVWLQGRAPLLYVGWPTRIDVLSCARGPDFWDHQRGECQYNPAAKLELEVARTTARIARELERFSAFRLADGTFWDDPQNAALVHHDKASHQSLIQAIVEADKDLDGQNNPILRRLLLLMVLVKYLEDRKVFPNDGWFGRYHKGARSFFDVLKSGDPSAVGQLLAFLETKFDGDVFDLSVLGQERLTSQSLTTFAHLVEARTLSRQRYLWEQFSFEHLPVEIISHLYQRFVEGGHGTVYTPPFLAALLLDHAMPYGKLTGQERILDPACGSGVFLVGAFRRLISVWRSQHNWNRPDVRTLKGILQKSIYGIDLDHSAIDLTAFSLSLAICDALKPDVIWRDLKFDRLRDSHLFEGDFFSMCLDAKQHRSAFLNEGFDIVVGNPPFESKLTAAGEQVDKIMQKEDGRDALPDNQAAYLFLEQAFTTLRSKDACICMIQPAGFLYNRKVDTFRSKIFRKHHIEIVLDFASIRNLYKADPKTVAVLARKTGPLDSHRVVHWTFRRTVSVKERICFELDHYDRHSISQEQAETNMYVWRANLLGGERLIVMGQRLRNMRTLAQYTEKKGERDWDYGEGFVAARGGRRELAPFLTGKPLLPTDAFTEDGIDESKITTVTETHFRSAYTQNRYTPPLVLMKENSSLPIAFWDKGFIAYKAKIVGVHAPEHEMAELRRLYDILRDRHDFYRFSCALNGSQLLIGKATAIAKQDIDLLPFPEDHNDLSLSFWEQALQSDVLDYMVDYVRLGQNSELLRKEAEEDDMKAYARLFCRMLGSVYDNLRAADPIFLNGLTCQPFYFGNRPNLSWINEHAETELWDLVHGEGSDRLRTFRVVRFYLENVVLIVKPDRLRYWIRSTAIRDADEALVDLRQQGY